MSNVITQDVGHMFDLHSDALILENIWAAMHWSNFAMHLCSLQASLNRNRAVHEDQSIQ